MLEVERRSVFTREIAPSLALSIEQTKRGDSVARLEWDFVRPNPNNPLFPFKFKPVEALYHATLAVATTAEIFCRCSGIDDRHRRRLADLCAIVYQADELLKKEGVRSEDSTTPVNGQDEEVLFD